MDGLYAFYFWTNIIVGGFAFNRVRKIVDLEPIHFLIGLGAFLFSENLIAGIASNHTAWLFPVEYVGAWFIAYFCFAAAPSAGDHSDEFSKGLIDGTKLYAAKKIYDKLDSIDKSLKK